MGRIVVQTSVTNPVDEGKSIRCGMLVDTGAGALVFPSAWRERLGRFARSEPVELQTANQEVIRGEACGPVEVRIEGFRPVWNEVVFLNMEPNDGGGYEPLLGYVILEQAQAAVDTLGHRLVPVRYIDMKTLRAGRTRRSDGPHDYMYSHARDATVATSARLAPETERRLDFLASQTGRTKAFYLRELIERGIEDLEDYYLAAEVLERMRKGEEPVHAAADVRRDLGRGD